MSIEARDYAVEIPTIIPQYLPPRSPQLAGRRVNVSSEWDTNDRRTGNMDRRFDMRYLEGPIAVEVAEMQADGYAIEVVQTADPAYTHPEAIKAIYDYLEVGGKQFAEITKHDQEQSTKRSIGGMALGLLKRNSQRAARRERSASLRQARNEIMYDDVEGGPWHDQRGCATALLTIQEAHNLKSKDDLSGVYPTMSAMLDESVLDHTFENGNSLTGMNLREAIIETGQRFYSKDRDSSARYADKTLGNLKEFIHAPTTLEFKSIVANCTDSLGIRSRKQIVSDEITKHLDRKLDSQPDTKEYVMFSVGCGTALPMLEVAQKVKERGVEPKLILLDQDPVALASAIQIATKMGLQDNIEIHCERLFSRFGKPLDMDKLLQDRRPDVIEDSGLREYLPDRIYVGLANASLNALADDGIMTSGNMNINRPQPEFLHGLMGWTPSVQMRKIKECLTLHEKAGIPSEAIDMKVTQEGVYTIYVTDKSRINR